MSAWNRAATSEIQRLAGSESAQGSRVIPVVAPDTGVAHETPVAPAPEVTNEHVYELRALASEAELYESYRLRYEVYGALGYLQSFNRSKLEVDIHDRSSI